MRYHKTRTKIKIRPEEISFKAKLDKKSLHKFDKELEKRKAPMIYLEECEIADEGFITGVIIID